MEKIFLNKVWVCTVLTWMPLSSWDMDCLISWARCECYQQLILWKVSLRWVCQAYAPPERLKAISSRISLLVAASYDVWSLGMPASITSCADTPQLSGVVMMELFSGATLWMQDLSDDSIVGIGEKLMLANWQQPRQEHLDRVFDRLHQTGGIRRDRWQVARELVQQCL